MQLAQIGPASIGLHCSALFPDTWHDVHRCTLILGGISEFVLILSSLSAAHFHPHFPGPKADDVVVGTLTLVTYGARQDVQS